MGLLNEFGVAAGSSLLGTGLGLVTQNLSNRNTYKWGEKAAESDFNRQMQLYERQYKDKSPLNVVNQLKEAGLNKGLMFSGGAGGVGGAASGTTAGTNKMGGAQLQQQQNLAVTMAQIENMKAQTELTMAQKSKTEAETQTTNESRTYLVDELRQRGRSQWLNNLREEYKRQLDHEDSTTYTNKITGDTSHIAKGSLFDREVAAEIFEIEQRGAANEATAKLTNTKTQNYWQELMNATAQANASTIQAAAQKLAAEFQFGEEANWKWWVEKGQQAAGTILNGIGKFSTKGITETITDSPKGRSISTTTRK